ncbi:hypothetical protein DH2020_024600 [Rehmannia glutinosa]|uniref:Retrovirus-related Pol polyprotein from transposon TNT 1-94-like beta-barrel domain-containing protein n=1 Tax=Rehmannia glutinosa TaxID=99300 RepID=A0ABR0W1Z3_REHGL
MVISWYKELKEQQRNNHSINLVDGGVNEIAQSKMKEEIEGKKGETPDFAAMIQKEIAKYLSGQSAATSGDIHSFSHIVDYSGTMLDTHYAMSLIHNLGRHSWIVDSGASRHICSYPELIDKPMLMPGPISVHLPDGTTVSITHTGNLQLTHEVVLKNVLIAPSFKYNLLSVSQLLADNGLHCVFSQNECWLQGPDGDGMKAFGKSLAVEDSVEVVHDQASEPVTDMDESLGRGKRIKHRPRWLNDYVSQCKVNVTPAISPVPTHNPTAYPFECYPSITHPNLSPIYAAFLGNITDSAVSPRIWSSWAASI